MQPIWAPSGRSTVALGMSQRRRISLEPVAAALTPRDWGLDRDVSRNLCHAVLLRAGVGHLISTDDPLVLAGPALMWAPRRAAERLRLEAGGAGYILGLSDDVLAGVVGRGRESLALSAVTGRTLAVTLTQERMSELALSFAAIERELKRADRGSWTNLEAHITLILVGLWRASGIEAAAMNSRGAASAVLQRFRHLLELHFRDHWPVPRYAQALAISGDRLHAICTRDLGRTPLKLIHERVVAEARLLLERSMLTVEQIADHLGFSDPAHFNRFFKQSAGVAPGMYRREAARRPAAAANAERSSYADWP